MQDRALDLQFEFLDFQIPGVRFPVRICLALAKGPVDPAVLSSVLQDQAEVNELTRRLKHPRRLCESFLARIAHQELIRRGIPSQWRHFSYSHTSDGERLISAAGVSEAPLGIDLELETRLSGRESLISRILTRREQEWIRKFSSETRMARALELWCAKEGLGKALGTGLQAPLSRFETHEWNDAILDFRNYPGWRAMVSRVSGRIIAACSPKF